ncbi:hypothetical protein D3C71_78390 [compost metagenome]
MQFYEQFYRSFGIRRAAQLLTPPLPELDHLNLPKRSVLHFVTVSPTSYGPASDEFIFRNITTPIAMAHVTELGDKPIGMPRRLPVPVDPLVRKYHIANRRFRLMRNFEQASRSDNTLVVYNYGFLPPLYRYPRSAYSAYDSWMNQQGAVWSQIAKTATESDRHQFVMLRLPKTLPSILMLNLGQAGRNQKMVRLFNSPEALMVLELWKWFGDQRANSMISKVPAEKLGRVNIVYEDSGRWFVANLGLLNSWRVAEKDELKANPKANTKGLPAAIIQRRFLRMLMSLQAMRAGVAPEVAQQVNAPPTKTEAQGLPAPTAPAPTTVIKQAPGTPKVNPETGAVELKTTQVELPTAVTDFEIDRPEDLQADEALDAKIEADLKELERISDVDGIDDQGEEVEQDEPVVSFHELEHGVMRVCDRLADTGVMSAAEYRRYQQLSVAYKSLPSPDGKTTLDKFIRVPQETLKIESVPIKEISTVVDKSMLKSSLLAFDQRYIKEVMQKDVAGMVLNVQNAGIAVTNYQVEKVETILGSYTNHIVKITPVEGASSTLQFKLPALEDDGTYRANGVKYRMRKQRGDLPIRKTGPDRVALTSYYGKAFVNRSPKVVNDWGQWLRNTVMAMGLDAESAAITELHPGEVFDNAFKCPKLYSALAMGFRSFTLEPFYNRTNGYQGKWLVNLDHTAREKLYGLEAMKAFEQDGSVILGARLDVTDSFLVVDKHNNLYRTEAGTLVEMAPIEEMLLVDRERVPVDFAELKVLGRTIPIGLVLGYELGLEKLMKFLQVTPRRVPAGQRAGLAEDEWSLVFSDETLIFSRDDQLASMILGGFNEYHRTIRQYSVYEFDRRGVYLNVLEANGNSARYVREMDLMYQMFVDPITRDLLIEMEEPTDFRGLLIRSCEMLLTDQHPDELDPAYMRIKGYERMAGAVYSEVIKSIRAHGSRSGKSRVGIDLHPYAVWKNIAQDPSIALVSDINPIENLKQQEAVTYAGTGGRGGRSMTKHTRAYHENDPGTISESTVDSSDVGINIFTSADPQFTSLRGISKRFKKGETGASALLSTSALLSPGSDRDDPKRVNFVGIQHSHGVACSGYRQAAVRTGYEQVVPHRTSDLFALTAKKPGRVESVSDTGIVVRYDDGEVKGYELGRRYGNAAGLTIPHSVVSDLKEGQKFAEGTLICHNEGFFERDVLNPNNVVWKAGIIVKTVLMESTQTLEDSSSISKRAAGLLTTKMTKVKDVVITFDQSVRKLVKIGDQVEAEDILCIIENAVTASTDLFDDESLDTLRLLSAQAPLAKAKGVVERIEVYYHGEKEDMSEALRVLANTSDRELSKRNKSAGREAFTGLVDDGFRVDGDPLQLDTACIRIYITSDVAAGVGDKGVFCNQMKTVFGEVLEGEITTESGKVIDAVFGQKSIADRIVLSPEIIGTTTTLLDVIAKKALAAYKKS